MHYIGMLPVWLLRFNDYLIQSVVADTIFSSMFIVAILVSIGIIALALSCIVRLSKTRIRWIVRLWGILFGWCCAVFVSWDITYPDGEELVKTFINGGSKFEYTSEMFKVYASLWPLFYIVGIIFGYCLVWFLYRIGECVFFSLSSNKKQDKIVSSQKS
jgi:hypothetical protein